MTSRERPIVWAAPNTPDAHVSELSKRHPDWMVHYEALNGCFWALPIKFPGTWWFKNDPRELDYIMSSLDGGIGANGPPTAVDIPAYNCPPGPDGSVREIKSRERDG